jgi:hypothetical protein
MTLAALMRSLNPNMHINDVEGIIKNSADKKGGYTYDVNGFHPEMGYGRINAGTALEMMHAPMDDESIYYDRRL